MALWVTDFSLLAARIVTGAGNRFSGDADGPAGLL
jgi:hypothetical protein